MIWLSGRPCQRHERARAASPSVVASLVASVVTWVAAGPLPAQDFSDVQIQVQHVAGNVYMLTGSGGNIGVSAGPDGILIVDDQFAPLAGKIKAALADLVEDSEGEVSFILNTHFHGDHTGGNRVFGAEAPIIAHANVRKRLASGSKAAGRESPPAPAEALPVITFENSISVYFNGEQIRAIHLPHGHTDGDAVIRFLGSNVVHMGDDFFSGRFPFVDLDSGGSVTGLAENVATVLSHVPADAKVIPGHGPLSDVAGLRAFHEMLVASLETVGAAIAQGKTLAEVQAAGLPDRWRAWGGEFVSTDRWLGIVFRSLSRNGGAAPGE